MTIWLRMGRERKKKPNDKVYIYSIWPKNTSCLFWLRFSLRQHTRRVFAQRPGCFTREKAERAHVATETYLREKKKTYRHKIESFQRLLTGLIQRCLQICRMWFKCINRKTNMKPCEEQGRHKKNYLRTTFLCLTDSVSPWILCFPAAIYSCQLFQCFCKKEDGGGQFVWPM